MTNKSLHTHANPFGLPEVIAAPLALPQAEFLTVQALRQHGVLSRTRIAEAINYSPAKITSVVNKLTKRGIIRETQGESASTGGRRQRDIAFDGEFGYVVAINLDRSVIEIALVNLNEQVRVRRLLPVDEVPTPEHTIEFICDFVIDRLTQLDIPLNKVFGVGMSLPVAVNTQTQQLFENDIFPTWASYQIESHLVDNFPYAVIQLQRTVDAKAFGELRLGEGQEGGSFVYVDAGMPPQMSIVANGTVYHGGHGYAGNITRLYERTYREHYGEATSSSAAVDAKVLGIVLASVVDLLDPELILIGGAADVIGHEFLAIVRSTILNLSASSATQYLQIRLASLGAEAGMLGLTRQVLEGVFVMEGAH
jgi:predicted NBD/HSP70 family sugar kinase